MPSTLSAARASLTALLLGSTMSLAQTTDSNSSCAATGGRFCDLRNYLHGLEAIAVLLAVVLLVVIIGTVVYFRRVRRMKLEP